MNRLRLVLGLVLLASVGLSALSLLLPTPTDAEISQYYSPIATSVVLVDVFLALGNSVLFLMALRDFRPELKAAYRLIVLSTIIVGLGLLVIPYIEYYGLWEDLALNMSSYLQYFIAAPLMFLGISMIYKKVGFARRTMFIAAAVGIVICAAIHPFLPYDNSWPLEVWQYNLFKVVAIAPFVLYGVSAFMVFKLRNRAGHSYVAAFNWLSAAMVFYTINTLGIILIEVIGYDNPLYSLRLYEIPAILGDLCLLFAGYSFAAIGKARVVHDPEHPVSSVDIIIYAASKVSDRTKIDGYLDDMRGVTSSLQAGQVPQQQDQDRLRDVYLKVESFLVTNDPLRAFKQDDLRADIAQYFNLVEHGQKTFWPSL